MRVVELVVAFEINLWLLVVHILMIMMDQTAGLEMTYLRSLLHQCLWLKQSADSQLWIVELIQAQCKKQDAKASLDNAKDVFNDISGRGMLKVEQFLFVCRSIIVIRVIKTFEFALTCT